jgi:hypothetical protein
MIGPPRSATTTTWWPFLFDHIVARSPSLVISS